MSTTLNLTNAYFLGRGAHRECYRNPINRNQCIKIVYNPSSGGRKELQRELNYYKHLTNQLTDWSSLTKYYGKINTNLGTGYIYDMIRNKDGSSSNTLAHYLTQNKASGNLFSALDNLKKYIKNNKIMTMTIKPQNILCQFENNQKFRLVIVDNLGDSVLIPLSKISNTVFNIRLNKKWNKFMSSLNLSN